METTYLTIKEEKDKIEITAKIQDKQLDEKKVNTSVKQISKILKKNKLKKKEIIIETNLDLEKDEKRDNQYLTLISALNACKIKDKNERMEYIYMCACKFLDNIYLENNICEFCDNVCLEKRKYLNSKVCYDNIRDGCCHKITLKYLFTSRKTRVPRCIYQQEGRCITTNLGCKMFACDTVRKKGIKYTYFNVALVKYFFNLPQIIIMRCSLFTHKDKVLKRIKLWNF